MTRFRAAWIDGRGDVVGAELEAPDRDALLDALDADQRASLVRLAPTDQPDGPGDVAWAGRALAGLLSRGVPLGDALRHLAGARRGVVVRELERAAAAADEGGGLAAALERGPLGRALASPLARGLVETGERASRLPDLLLEASRLVERLASARRRALDALAYPAVVLAGVILVMAGVATTTGVGLADLLRAQPDLQTGVGRGVLEALAWAGERPRLTWGVALGALALLATLWRTAGVGLAPLRVRPVRDAAVLQALAALVEAALSPAEAARLLDEGAPGLLPPAASRALVEGAPPSEGLAQAGVVDAAERLALTAAAQAGPRELAAALREVAAFRLTALEDRARALATRLGVAIELGVGLALLAMAIPFLGSGWR